MSEVSPLQDSRVEEIYLPYESEYKAPPWEKMGKAALITFSFIAACAFVPALFKKKRVFTPAFGNQAAPIVVVETPVEPPPPQAEAADERPPGVIEKAPVATQDKQDKIRWMFNTAAAGEFTIRNIVRLLALENELDDVHPFEFLRVAPREKVRSIFQELFPLKANNVMRGIKKGMEREKAGNNLNRYVQGFAADMGKEADPIKQYIQADDWRGLVNYLYDIQ